ncbi:MAG: hypothetical protein RRY97_08565 [Oscillibacter sp.]
MKPVSEKELIRALVAENGALKSQLSRATSDVDYIAMMANIDITPVETEGKNNEPTL